MTKNERDDSVAAQRAWDARNSPLISMGSSNLQGLGANIVQMGGQTYVVKSMKTTFLKMGENDAEIPRTPGRFDANYQRRLEESQNRAMGRAIADGEFDAFFANDNGLRDEEAYERFLRNAGAIRDASLGVSPLDLGRLNLSSARAAAPLVPAPAPEPKPPVSPTQSRFANLLDEPTKEK